MLAALVALGASAAPAPARAAPLGAWLRARIQRPSRRAGAEGVPGLVVKPWRRRAVLEHAGADHGAAQLVVRLLNSRRAMTRELEPLPMDRFDVSARGSRGLSAKHASLPRMILRLTGVGVVKAKGDRYVIAPPKARTRLSSVRHLAEMGSAYVARDGTIWAVGNDSPYGAYALDDMKHKVAMTEKLGGPDDIKLVAAGRYRGSQMGWLAYTIPADAQAPQAIFNKSRGLYRRALHALGERLRALHQRGGVHLQLHPGNWFVRVVDSKPRVVISDWATAQLVDALPTATQLQRRHKSRRSESFERLLRGLSPKDRAQTLDLWRTLERSAAPESDSVFTRLGFRSAEVAHRLRAVIATLSGYHGWKLSRGERRAMVAGLTKAYRALTMAHLVAGGGEERGIKSYADIGKAHFGGMAQKSAMRELYLRVARASRQDAALLRRDLRGSNRIVRSPTGWFEHSER